MNHFLKHKKVRRMVKILFWILFAVYVGYMIELLFLNSFRMHHVVLDYNLVPFDTIWMYIEYFDQFNFKIWFSNLFGNILAFMPLGFIIPLLVKRMQSVIKVLWLSFFTTVTVEVSQLMFHVGGFDVDDIILNTVGGILGYMLLLFLNNNFHVTEIPQSFD